MASMCVRARECVYDRVNVTLWPLASLSFDKERLLFLVILLLAASRAELIT